MSTDGARDETLIMAQWSLVFMSSNPELEVQKVINMRTLKLNRAAVRRKHMMGINQCPESLRIRNA
jgi:hypothetical protein